MLTALSGRRPACPTHWSQPTQQGVAGNSSTLGASLNMTSGTRTVRQATENSVDECERVATQGTEFERGQS